MRRYKSTIIILLLAFSFFSCAHPGTRRGDMQAGGALIGAGTGSALAYALSRSPEGAIIGAIIGGFLGSVTGDNIATYMDQQERTLRDQMSQCPEATINRRENVLMTHFKSDFMFDKNSATIKRGAYAELNRLARILRQYKETLIQIEGHTSQEGTWQHNQWLSEQRANAVKNALYQMGVEYQRMTTIGFGESQPISESPHLNRRVTVVIIPVQGR